MSRETALGWLKSEDFSRLRAAICSLLTTRSSAISTGVDRSVGDAAVTFHPWVGAEVAPVFPPRCGVSAELHLGWVRGVVEDFSPPAGGYAARPFFFSTEFDRLPIAGVAVDAPDDVALKLVEAKRLADKRTVGHPAVPLYPPHVAMATARIGQQGLRPRLDLGSLGERHVLNSCLVPVRLLGVLPHGRRRAVYDVDRA